MINDMISPRLEILAFKHSGQVARFYSLKTRLIDCNLAPAQVHGHERAQGNRLFGQEVSRRKETLPKKTRNRVMGDAISATMFRHL